MTSIRAVEQAATVARFELRRFLNSHRIVGILAIVLLLAVTILAVPTLSGDAYASSLSLAEAFGFWVPLIAIGLGLLFGADAIVGEFTSETGHIMLPNPVSRPTILLGKFLAAILASWSALIVYYAITFGFSVAIFQEAAFAFLPSFAYAMLYTVAQLAFIFLISAIAPSVTSSVASAFLILAIFFPFLGRQLRDVSVWHLAILTEAGSLTHRLLDLTATLPAQALVDGLVTVGLYTVVSLVVAGGVFIYREE